jgi:hypothetical protein
MKMDPITNGGGLRIARTFGLDNEPALMVETGR